MFRLPLHTALNGKREGIKNELKIVNFGKSFRSVEKKSKLNNVNNFENLKSLA